MAAPSKKAFERADRAQLRKWCAKFDLPWKKSDEEDLLRKRLRAFFIKSKEAEQAANDDENEEKAAKRGIPLRIMKNRGAIDEKTGEMQDCFGWFHNKESKLCAKCPDREACAPLSKEAVPFIKAAEADVEAEEEAENTSEEEVDDMKKAISKRAKKLKEAEHKHALKEKKKRAEEDEDEEEEEEEDDEPTITKPKLIADESLVEVTITSDEVDGIDFEGNKDLEAFYRRLVRVADKKPKRRVRGRLLRKLVAKILGVSRSEAEKLAKTITNDMQKAGEIKVVR